MDPALQVNLVWSPTDGITREHISPVPDEIAALMEDVSADGKLVEQESPCLGEDFRNFEKGVTAPINSRSYLAQAADENE